MGHTSKPRLAVVLVHYRTPELVSDAVEALRRDLGAEAEAAEWLLVDNGCDSTKVELLRRLPVRIATPGRNLGFAGGVNLGLASTTAPLVLVLNPDVLVRSGCTDALTRRLEAGAAVAGPRFFWDRGARMLLPPPERRTRRDELWSLLADRGEGWATLARRRWRRHAWRHWCASQPLRSLHLSGALLALRREVFDRVGPFDEGFQLYFEETDWLLRLEKGGDYGEYVPEAEAVHLYARSAVQEHSAVGWFEESRRRFQRRHYGAWFELLFGLLARPRRLATPGSGALEMHLDGGSEERWIELAPGERGFPAAAERLEGGVPRWQPPREIEERLGAGRYSQQVVAPDGRELLHRTLCWRGPAPHRGGGSVPRAAEPHPGQRAL